VKGEIKMFSTIMLAPALFSTTPKRKHQHITDIVLDTNNNTIVVNTNKHIGLIFKGNYINNDKILKDVVNKVNRFFREENTGVNNTDIDGVFIEYGNNRKYLKQNGIVY
jgi:hypothetical protein